jgi:phenylpropionate dioxygenase-like ring-hydroxylating dioxygenase large terminal subunit
MSHLSTDGTAALITALISGRPRDHSLPQPFYMSPDIYRLDMERSILKHWHCAGHVSQIRQTGAYFLFEIDAESVIIIRGKDGAVRALANVCRHRGSRICSGPSGRATSVLVCPYHAWAYNLDGSLRNARMMPEGFDRSAHGLKPVALKVVEGLIFVSLAEKPLPFTAVEDMLHRNAEPYGWAEAEVAHQETYRIAANWKLALENQVECYHCGPSHPEYSRVHGQGHAETSVCTPDVMRRMAEQGVDIRIRDQWALQAAPGQEADYCTRYSMYGGAVTASQDGKPVAPLMGRLTQYDGGFTVFYIGVLNHFLAYADYGAIFRYTPRSVSETDFHVTWLVRAGTQPGKDFDLERLTWMWRMTAAADKRIVEENQLGVASRFYQPGPYALPIESNTQRLTEWYLHDLTARLQARHSPVGA